MIQLLPFQAAPASNNLRAVLEHRVCIDASDTGTGKTYVNSHVARHLGAPVGVICPKAVIPVWERTLDLAGVEPLFVLNYEKLRVGRTPWGRWNVKNWEWSPELDRDTLLLWDEGQRCKGQDTQNARMLKASQPYRNIVMSATLAQEPQDMRAVGYLLGMHKWTNFYMWCLANGCCKLPFGGFHFKKKTAHQVLARLHKSIFPAKGSRIRIRDLGDAFPSNLLTCDAYDMGDKGATQEEYENFEAEILRIVESMTEGTHAEIMAAQQKLRQATEILKVPGLCSMAEDAVADGSSVVIFTNFTATRELICQKLGITCAVFGGQTVEARQFHIDEFQADRQRIIVVNIQAGGAGISLHDTHGNHPRLSLICPTYNAMDLRQVFGRIHRAGGLTPAIQKVIYAAGSMEEQICRVVQGKLNNIDMLNDGDLDETNLFADKIMKKVRVRG